MRCRSLEAANSVLVLASSACAGLEDDPPSVGGSGDGMAGEPGVGATRASHKNPICDLPVDPGPCTEALDDYYFDSKTGTCRPFVYGGCGGNENRLGTEAWCYQVCGNCRAVIPQEGTPCDGEDVECFGGYPFQFVPSCYCNGTTWTCLR